MIRLSCLLLLIFTCIPTEAAHLKNITKTQTANKTSLFFTMDAPFTYQAFTLTNPNRVIVDLNGSGLALNINQLPLMGGLIHHVRSGVNQAKTLRLVFDVQTAVGVTSVPWKSPSGYGLQVTMLPKALASGQAPFKPVVLKALKPQNMPIHPAQSPQTQIRPSPQKALPIKVSHNPSLSRRKVIVVLDAGHGGKDPGARGPRKSREKDVVLAITVKLKQLIDRQPGMRAVLTRSGDYYVGLRNRLDIARKYNGDVFVSIHADAFNNPRSHGASVFALSQSGATSEAARWIAEKENYSELGGVNLGDLDDQNGVVRSVLIDLSQTATINSGLQMGSRVLSQLHGFTLLHNNRVEQARFMVLKSPDIPSILVETGFISNPTEERNLTSPAYQARLSQAIFQGIKTYFWESPPHGTLIEAMTSGRFHIVRNGDTLPSIARNYHVSVASLQSINNFWGNTRPRPGQKIMIPSTWA